jgi:hypothetical protein
MVIEFAGTPCSGKDSVISSVISDPILRFKLRNVSTAIEPIKLVNRDLNWFGSTFFSLLYLEQMNLMIEAQNLDRPDSLVILNRGVFDRLGFNRLAADIDEVSRKIALGSEKIILESGAVQRADLIFLFLTSYEKAISRKLMYKKLFGTNRTVNPGTIDSLNNHYLDLYYELCQDLPIVLIDDLRQDMSLAEKAKKVKKQIRRIMI